MASRLPSQNSSESKGPIAMYDIHSPIKFELDSIYASDGISFVPQFIAYLEHDFHRSDLATHTRDIFHILLGYDRNDQLPFRSTVLQQISIALPNVDLRPLEEIQHETSERVKRIVLADSPQQLTELAIWMRWLNKRLPNLVRNTFEIKLRVKRQAIMASSGSEDQAPRMKQGTIKSEHPSAASNPPMTDSSNGELVVDAVDADSDSEEDEEQLPTPAQLLVQKAEQAALNIVGEAQVYTRQSRPHCEREARKEAARHGLDEEETATYVAAELKRFTLQRRADTAFVKQIRQTAIDREKQSAFDEEQAQLPPHLRVKPSDLTPAPPGRVRKPQPMSIPSAPKTLQSLISDKFEPPAAAGPVGETKTESTVSEKPALMPPPKQSGRPVMTDTESLNIEELNTEDPISQSPAIPLATLPVEKLQEVEAVVTDPVNSTEPSPNANPTIRSWELRPLNPWAGFMLPESIIAQAPFATPPSTPHLPSTPGRSMTSMSPTARQQKRKHQALVISEIQEELEERKRARKALMEDMTDEELKASLEARQAEL